MTGTMMQFPLTLTPLLERARKLFPRSEVVSRLPDKSIHRYTYADFYRRARALAGALDHAGLKRGDRVATLMWNSHAHLEAYFGIPAAGGVLHTLNLRLHPRELAFIINHAEDRVLLVDDVLLPVYEKVKDHTNVERVIVVRHCGQPLPDGTTAYEEFLGTAPDNYSFPALDESEPAAMCYTSGTTGNPKGVVYTHRSLVLHSMASGLPDALGLSQRDVVLPVVPMFHANAWGIPFTATAMGAKQVYPGPNLDAVSVLDLFEQEQVTFSGGVPTVWLGVLEALEQNPTRWKLVPGLRMPVGGSAPPESMIRRLDRFNLRLVHAYGLTETSPLATTCHLMPQMMDWTDDEKLAVRCRQGRPVPFVEMRLINDAGEAPWDGKTLGEIQLRGPWVASSYYNLPAERDKWTPDGWFRTGDVASVDPNGYIKISDRTKDLIKSGGEWISSVDLENTIMGHPQVMEAAVIAIPDPKWQERPLAIVVPRAGQPPTPDELRVFLEQKFAKWQIPQDFVFVESIPHTATGKMLKTALRDRFRSAPSS